MKARLIAQAKEVHDDGSIVEIVVWELAEPLPPSAHSYKYRLYFGRAGECLVRYDNERARAITGMSPARSTVTISPRWKHCSTISSAMS